MKSPFVRVGQHVVNLDLIADAHWEGEMLYVHLSGGFAKLRGREATLIWNAIEQCSRDLESSNSSSDETA